MTIECPSCACPNTRVVDSRDATYGRRRTRKCDDCGHRFPTVELSAVRFKAINDAAALVERFEKLRREYR